MRFVLELEARRVRTGPHRQKFLIASAIHVRVRTSAREKAPICLEKIPPQGLKCVRESSYGSAEIDLGHPAAKAASTT